MADLFDAVEIFTNLGQLLKRWNKAGNRAISQQARQINSHSINKSGSQRVSHWFKN